MPPSSLLIGEFPRRLDERFRVSLPTELSHPLLASDTLCTLAKERPGCLSLWNDASWQHRLDQAVALVEAKMQAGKLEGRLPQVQSLGRLLSARHKQVEIAGRSRLVIPEGFRQFLQVEPGQEVMIVGAALCVEIWNPARWQAYLNRRLPRFRRLLDRLAE
jgi:MraZ protein